MKPMIPTSVLGGPPPISSKPRHGLVLNGVFLLACVLFGFSSLRRSRQDARDVAPSNTHEILGMCAALHAIPVAAAAERVESDRYVPGTPSVVLRNATIWTGGRDGMEVKHADVLLSRGLIRFVGHITERILEEAGVRDHELAIEDLHGAWVTPGVVDLHSHMGVGAVPSLAGASDGNSLAGITQPWLRALDGLNTHDESYRLSTAGGITTSLILPGSANSIGGQGFVIKLRPTEERSSFSKLLEPPFTYNGSGIMPIVPPRWRHLKQACGENPSRVYGVTRMDSIYALRAAYTAAKKVMHEQDSYCDKAASGKWIGLGEFPESLQWEMLVDVMRGRVKVHTHCYEAVDLDGLVRLSNEFKFPIAAFHHAHETYLVPQLLKKAYGQPPASAMFAAFARYKRESYRHSQFAPRILHDNHLKVVMKSDHPFPINSRDLIFEAQQAHYHGLPHNVALASVTSTPAAVLGLSHRIGFIRADYDADLVVWDSHPLALGATPKQVYIDGIAQLDAPHVFHKPAAFQVVPQTPNFDKEAADAVKYEGLPPLDAKEVAGTVIFTGVRSLWRRSTDIHTLAEEKFSSAAGGTVIVNNGRISCVGDAEKCAAHLDAEVVDLAGGSLAPGFTTYGTPLGLADIALESATTDGIVPNPLVANVPSVVGGSGAVFHASDGLQFSTRDALLAYRAGVTTGIVAPEGSWLAGVSAAFALGAPHKLADGAMIQHMVALHVAITHGTRSSVSTQLGTLRRLLRGEGDGDLGTLFERAAAGDISLVIQVNNADIMATLLELKTDMPDMRMTFAGGAEAHLLAKEIAKANVGVIVAARQYPLEWQGKRMSVRLPKTLPSLNHVASVERPPLSAESSVSALARHNVTVGLGTFMPFGWGPINTRFDVAWAALESGGDMSKTEALALASTNLEKLLGITSPSEDLVAYRGGDPLQLESKVVGVLSPGRGLVDLF